MGQAFEVDRGMISQAGVDALFVVEAIDVAGNGGVELGIAREAAAVSELGLQGMEEAFHMSVVLAVARAVHAGDDAVGLEIVLVAVGRVLDATIGVEEQSGLGSASRDRALERPQGYLSGAVASERPAHDAPREQIHHRGQVAPALAQTQVREIAHPDLVGARRQGLIQAQVARLGEEPAHYTRTLAVKPAHAGAQPQFAHQARHALVAAADALAPEHFVHARRAVASAAIAVDALDPGAQCLVVAQALAAVSAQPGVEPAPRDLVAPAKKRHAVLRVVLGYELELRLRRSILKRMAFFKRSCSTSRAASFLSSARTWRRAWTFASSSFTCRLTERFSASAFAILSTFGKLKPAASAAGLSLPSR